MPDQPLQPFTSPFALFDRLRFSGSLPADGEMVIWALYAVFAFWAVYTIVAIYHWLKYSNASWIAFPSMAIHLYVSFALMSYALSGNAFFFSKYLP